MGWTNTHLYELRAGGVGWRTPDPDADWTDFLDARKARLGDILEDIGTKTLVYLYDFGDGWEQLHRVAVIGSGTLDSLPHNGAVVTLLAVCGTTHRESYMDIVMVGIVGAIIALGVVIGLGSAFGSFWKRFDDANEINGLQADRPIVVKP